MFQVVLEDTYLVCANGGQFKTTDTATNVLFENKKPIIEGANFQQQGTPCTKQAASNGAIPNCMSFLPATTFVVFSKVDGKRPVANLSVQMCKENMIPAMTYTSMTLNVKVN